MRPSLEEAQTVSRHTQPRADAWPHNPKGRNAGQRRGGIMAVAGALLLLVSAWVVPWDGVAAGSTVAGMARDAHAGAPLLAVGIGVLSWLGAVVIVAALLLWSMLLLNALVHQYWPQNVRQALDSVPPSIAAATAAPEDQQRDTAVVVRE
jgi:hypothetical protein